MAEGEEDLVPRIAERGQGSPRKSQLVISIVLDQTR